jgi:signal transduction histidine kinase
MEGFNGVEISVADTGVGIPPEACDRIFDPFFTTKEDGTGLGLATVHRIVEAHGGTLRVESAPGVGTTFWIQLFDFVEAP